MIIITDCGSTKALHALIDGDSVRYVMTAGFNGVHHTSLPENYAGMLADVRPERIIHYGAGCIGGATDRRVASLLGECACGADVEVYSDMVGAARGTLGTRRGVACILGTGSNTCLWDGTSVEDNVPALGYILGDEGSGAVIGRNLLRDIYKRRLPTEVTEEFEARYGLTRDAVIEKVYRCSGANRFMASFAPFVLEHIEVPAIRDMVTEEFARFVSRNIMAYPGVTDLPVTFTGSVAYHFAELLRPVCVNFGLTDITITKDPVDGLIKYHIR